MNEFKLIAILARPYYNFVGPNDWSHIMEVRHRATAMTEAVFGRQLTVAEYAAVLFHDCAKHVMGADNHAHNSAISAETVLMPQLSPVDLDEALEAIAVHDSNLAQFPSVTAELLASADANPPDAAWMLNKSFNWQLRHGIQNPIAGVMAAMPKKYGTGGRFHYPEIYRRYYGERLLKMQRVMDELTADKALDIITQYRAAHGLPMDMPGYVPLSA